jgi:transcriptional regulator with XRE-family HTH domain
MNTDAVANRLKAERIRQGLSQREVARRAEVSNGAIQRVEAGQAYDWMYGRVAAVLGIDVILEESA